VTIAAGAAEVCAFASAKASVPRQALVSNAIVYKCRIRDEVRIEPLTCQEPNDERASDHGPNRRR
jgi:hypothetical protein